jgi:L-ornithine N5-oxygenase
VVDTELIDQLYRALYNDRLRGTQRHRIRPLLDLTGVSDTGDAFRLEFQNLALDQPEFLDADGVVLATGYERSRRLPLLEQLSSYLDANDQGEYHVGRCYRLAARPNFTARVFMQGFCEHSHGLSDTLLSDLPIRAEQILRAMHAPMHAS